MASKQKEVQIPLTKVALLYGMAMAVKESGKDGLKAFSQGLLGLVNTLRKKQIPPRPAHDKLSEDLLFRQLSQVQRKFAFGKVNGNGPVVIGQKAKVNDKGEQIVENDIPQWVSTAYVAVKPDLTGCGIVKIDPTKDKVELQDEPYLLAEIQRKGRALSLEAALEGMEDIFSAAMAE